MNKLIEFNPVANGFDRKRLSSEAAAMFFKGGSLLDNGSLAIDIKKGISCVSFSNPASIDDLLFYFSGIIKKYGNDNPTYSQKLSDIFKKRAVYMLYSSRYHDEEIPTTIMDDVGSKILEQIWEMGFIRFIVSNDMNAVLISLDSDITLSLKTLILKELSLYTKKISSLSEIEASNELDETSYQTILTMMLSAKMKMTYERERNKKSFEKAEKPLKALREHYHEAFHDENDFCLSFETEKYKIQKGIFHEIRTLYMLIDQYFEMDTRQHDKFQSNEKTNVFFSEPPEVYWEDEDITREDD
nr:hypothetical protein [Clostridia bacterium]